MTVEHSAREEMLEASRAAFIGFVQTVDSSARPLSDADQQRWGRWRGAMIAKHGASALMTLMPDKLPQGGAVLASLLNDLGKGGVVTIPQLLTDFVPIRDNVASSDHKPELLDQIHRLAWTQAIAGTPERFDIWQQYQQRCSILGDTLSASAVGRVGQVRQQRWEDYRAEQKVQFGPSALTQLLPPKYDSGWRCLTRTLRVLDQHDLHTEEDIAAISQETIRDISLTRGVGKEVLGMFYTIHDLATTHLAFKQSLAKL